MGDDSKPTVVERPGSKPASRRGAEAASGQPALPQEGAPLGADAPPAPASARYAAGEEIARGGMGRVIEATDTRLDRIVAVKEALTSDPDALRRFAREVRITARLEHPSIVPVYDASGAGEEPFYVMRRVSGRPLEELIGDAPTVSQRLALIPHVLAAAQALAHAHRRGIIHRDVKPTNILVGDLGETVVIDWGLAKAMDEPDDEIGHGAIDAGDSLRTHIGVVSGTPGFMSPEQARGEELGAASDVWALGATLHHVLSGRPPHHRAGVTGDTMIALTAARPVPAIGAAVAGVPRELAAIIDKALAYAPRERYVDAAAFAEDLQRFLTGQLVASHHYSPRERLVRWIRRHRGTVAIGAIAIVLVASVSTLAVSRVVAARDRADAQAKLADTRRLEAETQRARAQERADSELLARARAVVFTNPTLALAVLRELPADSPRSQDARGIARTAVMHGGAAWGIPGMRELIISVELSVDGTLLAMLSREGELQLWDLERRTHTHTLALGTGRRVHWIVDGAAAKLVAFDQGPTLLVDPVTGTATPTTLPELSDLAVSRDGTAIAGIVEGSRRAGWIDLHAGTVHPVAPVTSAPFEELWLTGDGTFLAARSTDALAVFDRAGGLLTQHAGEIGWVATSSAQRVAMIVGDQALETVVAKGSVWTPMNRGPVPKRMFTLEYMDERLITRSYDGMEALSAARPPRQLTVLGPVYTTVESVATEQFVTLSDASHLVVLDRTYVRTIALPSSVTSPKIAGRRGSSRVAIAGRDTVVILDLALALPARLPLPLGSRGEFVTDDLLLISMMGGDTRHWYRLSTGVLSSARIANEARLLAISEHGEVLGRDSAVDAASTRLVRVDEAHPGQDTEYRGTTERGLGGFVGHHVVFTVGRQLLVAARGAKPRQLLVVEDDPIALLPIPPREFALLTRTTLVRGSVETGEITRTAIEAADGASLSSFTGRLLVSKDTHLSWIDPGGHEVEIARFDSPIDRLIPVPSGVLVWLTAGGGVSFVDLAGPPRIAFVGPSLYSLATTAGRGVTYGTNHVELVDFPSLTRSQLPIPIPSHPRIAISPGGQRIVTHEMDQSTWLWTLPPAAATLEAMVTTATNARERDGQVVWPWQLATPLPTAPSSSSSRSRTAP